MNTGQPPPGAPVDKSTLAKGTRICYATHYTLRCDNSTYNKETKTCDACKSINTKAPENFGAIRHGQNAPTLPLRRNAADTAGK